MHTSNFGAESIGNTPNEGTEPQAPDSSQEKERILEEIERVKLEIQQRSPAEVIARYREARAANYTNRIDSALEQLPSLDTEHARAIYDSFADSPDPRDRGIAALLVHYLTPFDHEHGLRLWDRLIRDIDEGVRFYAYENLRDVLDSDEVGNKEAAGRYLQEHGIEWQDAFSLLHSYIRAERGSDLHGVEVGGTEST